MTARPDIDERMLDEAIAWQLALEQDDADWDGYTRWLEADPRHRLAFDEIALTERIVAERADELAHLHSIASPPAIPSPTRRGWLYGAVAAAVALAVGIPTFWPLPGDVIYATARGETRQIALGKGMSVALAPSSRLLAKGGEVTNLELVSGDAYFAVQHDPARQLSVKAGDYSVTDIGTTFGVNLSRAAVTVSVAEGNVSVAPSGGGATKVNAGQQLIAREGGHVQLSAVTAGNVGSWRKGRLVYSDAPLAAVVADIARYSGKSVTIDPAIEDRTFSGVLAIGDGSALAANLAELAALSYETKGDSVRLGAANGR